MNVANDTQKWSTSQVEVVDDQQAEADSLAQPPRQQNGRDQATFLAWLISAVVSSVSICQRKREYVILRYEVLFGTVIEVGAVQQTKVQAYQEQAGQNVGSAFFEDA
jgi:hypothetical protein